MVNSEAKTVYIVLDKNKLIKTIDFFHTWDTLFIYPGNISDFVVDTSYNPLDRIIIKGNNGAFLSLDGGVIWNPFTVAKMYAFGNNKIYELDDSTLKESSENGTNWLTINSPTLISGASFQKLFVDNNVLFVSMFFTSYIDPYLYYLENFYSSTDNGASWNYIFGTRGTGPCNFQEVKLLFNYLFASGYCENKSYLFEIPTRKLTSMIKRGEKVTIDRVLNLYTVTFESSSPMTFSLNISSDFGMTWIKEALINTNLNSVVLGDVLIDDSGFVYFSYSSGLYKTDRSVYHYFSVDTLAFGALKLNNTLSKNLTVYNPWNNSISFDSIVINNPAFSINSFNPQIIPPRGSSSITIGFTPTNLDTSRSDALFYFGKSYQQLELSGNSPRPGFSGLPQIIVFDGIKIDSTAAQKIVIKNHSINFLEISSITLVNHAEFSIDNHVFPIEISPNDSIILNVYFKPTQLVNYDDTLIINSNTTDSLKKILLQGINVVTHIFQNIEHLEFNLFQNYPNPFNPISTISYELPNANNVSLILYNINGEEVAELLNERKLSGRYEIRFNSNGLASGVYFCRLISGEYHKTIKMIIMK
jgi:hypothetical protein